MSQLSVLILGGAGKTGGRVNTLLLARDIATRPVSRSTAIPFDWTGPEPWPEYVRATAATGVWRA
jgi:hypothetical protein